MVGGNVLVVAGAETEKGTELIVASTESRGRPEFLESPHTSDPTFEAAVIRFCQPSRQRGFG